MARGDDVYIVLYTHSGGADFSVWSTWEAATDAAMETMRLFVESLVQSDPSPEYLPPGLDRLIAELDADKFPSSLREWDNFQYRSGMNEKLWVEETKVR